MPKLGVHGTLLTVDLQQIRRGTLVDKAPQAQVCALCCSLHAYVRLVERV